MYNCAASILGNAGGGGDFLGIETNVFTPIALHISRNISDLGILFFGDGYQRHNWRGTIGVPELATSTLLATHASAAPPYLGVPGRTPGFRGIWTSQDLEKLNNMPAGPLLAGIGFLVTESHSTLVEVAPGQPLATEGTWDVFDGSVNSDNGNKLTELKLFGWKNRGGLDINFTLYHNSQTLYSDELGAGWTWSYDDYLNLSYLSVGSVTVHWGTGLCVPYQIGSGSSYVPPPGIYDALVENSDSTWTLTKKDGSKYSYNASGFLTKIADRNGNAISLTLNSSNYVTAITDATGRKATIALDSNNRFNSVTSPSGQTWQFTRNASNDLTSVGWPSLGDGNSYADTFAYDSNNDIVSHTDKRGKVWSYGYGATYSSVLGLTTSEKDPLGHTWTFGYNPKNTTRTDPRGYTYTYNYATTGVNPGLETFRGAVVSSIIDEAGFTENYKLRDSNYNVLTLADKNGTLWYRTYDSLGNLLTLKEPSGAIPKWTYNSFAEVLTYTSGLSNKTVYAYDSAGNLLTITDPLGNVVETDTYNSFGQRITSRNALNNIWSVGYDGNGNLASVGDPLGETTQYGYDTAGRVVSVTDPMSQIEQFKYDAWERPVLITHADSSTAVTSYDGESNATLIIDELGHATNKTYDAAGRLIGVSNPLGNSESYGYDNADNITTITNGNGKVRTYVYTQRSGEVSSLTLSDGSKEQWSYDGTGELTNYINPLGQSVRYGFYWTGQPQSVIYPSGTNTYYTYDNDDRVTNVTDSTGSTTWTYDADSRLTALSTPQGNTSYGYDLASRRTSMTETSGSWSYSYDTANRLISQTNPFSETTSWQYDPASRATQITLANGQVDLLGYDNRDRQTSVIHQNSTAGVLSAESYIYDVVGNLSSKTIDSALTQYTYDAANQLLSESAPTFTASYTYDANGNRLTKTLNGSTDVYSYDSADKLQQIVNSGITVKQYGYDAAGRTTSITGAAGVTQLTYDYESRVTGIKYPSGATNAFAYNSQDTRVSKSDSTGSYTYRRDGISPTSDVLSDGVANYTSGISQHRAGATTYELSDRLGSSTKQTNPSQAITATRTYDAFGMLASTTGTPVGPFGFAGGEGYIEDADSSLKLLGCRYYDPSTGRFLTRDPEADGRNWYVYCDSNPLSQIDPTGNAGWGYEGSGYGTDGPGDTGSKSSKRPSKPSDPKHKASQVKQKKGWQKNAGNNEWAEKGKEWHRYVEADYLKRHPTAIIEKRLPGTMMRPDINDPDNKIIIDIKPYTEDPKKLLMYIEQARAYADRLGYKDVLLYFYPAKTEPEDFKHPMEHITIGTGHNGEGDTWPF